MSRVWGTGALSNLKMRFKGGNDVISNTMTNMKPIRWLLKPKILFYILIGIHLYTDCLAKAGQRHAQRGGDAERRGGRAADKGLGLVLRARRGEQHRDGNVRAGRRDRRAEAEDAVAGGRVGHGLDQPAVDAASAVARVHTRADAEDRAGKDAGKGRVGLLKELKDAQARGVDGPPVGARDGDAGLKVAAAVARPRADGLERSGGDKGQGVKRARPWRPSRRSG